MRDLGALPLRDGGETRFAGAAPGGVLIHCVGGRDRTGQITVLLLALSGVGPT